MSGPDFRSLFDQESFVETLAVTPGDDIVLKSFSETVTGYGTVGDRLVFAAFDADQDAVDADPVHGFYFAKKVLRIIKLAASRRAPFLLCLKGSGVSFESSQETVKACSEILDAIDGLCGSIPVICVSAGQCFGIQAAVAAACDMHFVIGGDSGFGALSDKGVEALTGASVNSEEKPGFNPSVTGIFKDVDEFKLYLTELLKYLPDSDFSSSYDGIDGGAGAVQGQYAVSVAGLKGRELINAVSDGGRFTELFGYSDDRVVTGFATFYGAPAGVICAEGYEEDGLVDYSSLEKLLTFLTLCSIYGLPSVFLLDFKGLKADLRENARMPLLLAQLNAELKSNPSLRIVTGEAYGELASVLLPNENGDGMSYAWNDTYIDALNPAALAIMKHGAEISDSEDPVKARERSIDEYKNANSRAEFAAVRGIVDDVIHPDETRDRIAAFLKIL